MKGNIATFDCPVLSEYRGYLAMLDKKRHVSNVPMSNYIHHVGTDRGCVL